MWMSHGDRVTAVETFRRESPRIVLLDLGLPPRPQEAAEGLEALEELLSIQPSAKIVILSGNTERENAIKAIDLHAVGRQHRGRRGSERADKTGASGDEKGIVVYLLREGEDLIQKIGVILTVAAGPIPG